MKYLGRFFKELLNLLLIVGVVIGVYAGVYAYVGQPFQVEGQSMEPSLSNGQQMVMAKQSAINRFDIVIFPDPEGSGDVYIKRLIGLPGDVLQIYEDELYINGEWIDEPYLEPRKSEHGYPFTTNFSLWEDLGMDEIPEGYAFVLGDNRPFSGDSRSFGLVPLASIEGKAVYTFLPKEKRGKVPDLELTPEGYLYAY